jgi:acetolactate synthase-1/2/3 large subunit
MLLSQKYASKDSYLLEVMVEKENNVFPMIPTGASVSEIRLS